MFCLHEEALVGRFKDHSVRIWDIKSGQAKVQTLYLTHDPSEPILRLDIYTLHTFDKVIRQNL